MTGDGHPDEPARYTALVTLGSLRPFAATCINVRYDDIQ